jgi:hypothetical protein
VGQQDLSPRLVGERPGRHQKLAETDDAFEVDLASQVGKLAVDLRTIVVTVQREIWLALLRKEPDRGHLLALHELVKESPRRSQCAGGVERGADATCQLWLRDEKSLGEHLHGFVEGGVEQLGAVNLRGVIEPCFGDLGPLDVPRFDRLGERSPEAKVGEEAIRLPGARDRSGRRPTAPWYRHPGA